MKKVIALFLSFLIIFSCFIGLDSFIVKAEEKNDFKLTMLDVGQGLCLIMESDGEYLVYDGGGRDYSSYVVSYCKKQSIDKFKYMFASHFDDDHINGLVGLLNTTEVEYVVSPDYKADTKIYESFVKGLSKNGAESVHPYLGEELIFGDVLITVISPDSYNLENENSMSLVIKLTIGDFSILVTGDAERDAEEEMLNSGYDLNADIYVVGHHGSSTSSSYDFVKSISPSLALISVGADNTYGHPSDETLNTLMNLNVNILRTDIDGEINCVYDGETFTVSCTKDKTAKKEENEQSTVLFDGDNKITYVCNTNTHKFHFPDCSSVDDMKEENKMETNLSREELINDGYSPCGRCKP